MNINPVPYEINQFIGCETYIEKNYDLNNDLDNNLGVIDNGEELDDLLFFDKRRWILKIKDNSLIFKQLPFKGEKLNSENENFLLSHKMLFPCNLFAEYTLLKEDNSNISNMVVYLKNCLIYIFSWENGYFKCDENDKILYKILNIREMSNEYVSNFQVFKKRNNYLKFSFKINKKSLIYIYKINCNFIDKLEFSETKKTNLSLHKSINYSNLNNNIIKYLFSIIFSNNDKYLFNFIILNKGLILVVDNNILNIFNYKTMTVQYTQKIKKSVKNYRIKLEYFYEDGFFNIVTILTNYELNKNKIYFLKFRLNNGVFEEILNKKLDLNIGELQSISLKNNNIVLNYYDSVFKFNKLIIWDTINNNTLIPYLISYELTEKYLNYLLIKGIEYRVMKNLIIDRVFKNKIISKYIITISLENLIIIINNKFRHNNIHNLKNKEKFELLEIFETIVLDWENRNYDETQIKKLFQIFYCKVIDSFNLNNIIKNIKIEDDGTILLIKNNFTFSKLKINNYFNVLYTVKIKVFEYLMNNYLSIFNSINNQNEYSYEKIEFNNLNVDIFRNINITMSNEVIMFVNIYCEYIKNSVIIGEYINYEDFISLYILSIYNLEDEFKNLIIKYNSFFKKNNYNFMIFNFDNNLINNIDMLIDFNYNYDNIINMEIIKAQSEEIERFNNDYFMLKIYRMIEDLNLENLNLLIKNYLISKISKEEVLKCNNNLFTSIENINLKFFFNKNVVNYLDLFVINSNIINNEDIKENILLFDIIDFYIVLDENNTKLKNLYNIILFLEELKEFSMMNCLIDLLDYNSIITSYYYLIYFLKKLNNEQFQFHYTNFFGKFINLLNNNSKEFYSLIFFYKNGKFSYNENLNYNNLYEKTISKLFIQISICNNNEIKNFFFNEIINDNFLNVDAKCNIFKSFINFKIENNEILECFNIIKYFDIDKGIILELLEKWNDSIIINNKIRILISLNIQDIYIIRVIDNYLESKKNYYLNELKNIKNKELKFILNNIKDIIFYKEKISFYYKDYKDALDFGFNIFIRFEEILMTLDENLRKELLLEIQEFELFLLNYLIIFFNYNEKYKYCIKNISNDLKIKLLNSMIEFEIIESYIINYNYLNKDDIEKFKQGILINNNIKIKKDFKYLIQYLVSSDKIREICSICLNNEIWTNYLVEILFFSLLLNIDDNISIDNIIMGFNLILKHDIEQSLNLLKLYLSVYENNEVLNNKKFNEEIRDLFKKYLLNKYPEKTFILLYNYNKSNIWLKDYFEWILKHIEKKLDYSKNDKEIIDCIALMAYYMDNNDIIYNKFLPRYLDLIKKI